MRSFGLGVVALSLVALSSAPALASHCPKDVAKIDEALAGSHDLSDAQVAEVTQLRNEGEQLHNDGDHDGAVEKLHQALEMLGMPHE